MDAKTEKSRKDLSLFFLILGVALLVFGGLHLFLFARSGLSINLYDAGFNGTAGSLALLCGWMVSKGRLIGLMIAIVFILAGLVYPFMIGRGFNYYFLFLALIILPWLYSLRKNGALP